MADEFGRMALAFLVSSNERHVGRLRGNRARVATTTDAMLAMATAMERETDGSERGGARLSLPGSQGIAQRRCATLEAGTQVGFDVRQGGLGRDEEAASLAGGPEPPTHTARTPHAARRTPHAARRTPHAARRTSDVGRRPVAGVLTRGRQALDRHACWLRSRGRWRASATTLQLISRPKLKPNRIESCLRHACPKLTF